MNEPRQTYGVKPNETAQPIEMVLANEYYEMRDDRNRWRLLAQFLCEQSEGIVIAEEIALLFPDLVKVNYE